MVHSRSDRDKSLVTGGMGFIGLHIVARLLSEGKKVDIIDNLSRSQANTIEVFAQINPSYKGRVSLYEIDLTKGREVSDWFKQHGARISQVIHLAALKSVPESIQKPELYYQTNYDASRYLIQQTIHYEVPLFVFSSTACVYQGECPKNGFIESDAAPLNRLNHAYGKSKRKVEMYLEILGRHSTHTSFIVLRYFNPIGNHSSGIIGESLLVSNSSNLFPIIWSVINGKKPFLSIFGNDYVETMDGTPERDFIVINDLVNAHLLFDKDKEQLPPGYYCYNVGTGSPTSVLQLIELFEKVLQTKVPYQYSERRRGDQPVSYACADKLKLHYGWSSQSQLQEAIQNASVRNKLLQSQSQS